jgi:hypothetical protein
MNSITRLFQGLRHDSNLLVPITHLSSHATQALEVLQEMVGSLPEGPFLDFINNLEYSTNVFGYCLPLPGIGVKNGLTTNYSQSITQPHIGLTEDSLVYMLYVKENSAVYYIGSASNGLNRIGQHLDSLKGLRPQDGVHIKLLSLGKPVYFGKIYTSTNYFNLAIRTIPNYQFSQGEVFILRALTEFVIRVLEQSLITTFHPEINSKYPVLFTYTSWDPKLLSVYDFAIDGSRAVQILNATNGKVIRSFVTSIEQASQILQISRNMANRYLQSNVGFYSTVFGCQVTLGVIGTSLFNKPIIHRKPEKSIYPTLVLPQGPLTNLASYVV